MSFQMRVGIPLCAVAAMLALAAAVVPAHSQTAPAAAVAVPAGPDAIGGVPYDASAPLDAVVTPLFDAKNPPNTPRTYHVRFRGAAGDAVPGLLTLPAP